MVLERKCREALQYCRAFCIYIRNGKWVSKMRTVLDCVNAFKALLTTEYVIILGRKGVSVTLRLRFDKKIAFI